MICYEMPSISKITYGASEQTEARLLLATIEKTLTFRHCEPREMRRSNPIIDCETLAPGASAGVASGGRLCRSALAMTEVSFQETFRLPCLSSLTCSDV
jgi:hypothetical protein